MKSKLVLTGKKVEKRPTFGLEIGLPVPLSSNSPGLLYMHQNDEGSVLVE